MTTKHRLTPVPAVSGLRFSQTDRQVEDVQTEDAAADHSGPAQLIGFHRSLTRVNKSSTAACHFM